MRLPPPDRDLLWEGVERFNAGRFWDAHESWEALWLQAEGPRKQFLQGLIQLTAAFHHFQRGTHRGGVRLADAAIEKLSGFDPHYLGIDRATAVRSAIVARDRASSKRAEERNDPLKEIEGPLIWFIERDRQEPESC